MEVNISLNSTAQNNKIKKFIKNFKSNFEFYILCAPVVLWVFIFSYIPMVGILIPFKKIRYDIPIWKSEWIGFDNFKFFFISQDAWRITRNTVLMNIIFIITGTVFSIIFALMLNEINIKRHIKVFQTSMFLPYYLSWECRRDVCLYQCEGS